jgi:hypothetical protein
MPFSNELLPNAPILIHRLEPGPDAVSEIPIAMQATFQVINDLPQPVYLVLNLTGLTMGLDDMMQNSSRATRGPDALLHHPNIIETLFVVSDNFIKMGVMGMTSDVFGNARIRTFDTVDHALEYCYERIAETADK